VRSDLVASLAVAFGSVLWGLYWLPVRYLGELGFSGSWPGLVLFLASILVLLPFAVARRRQLLRAGPGLAVTGLMTGAAFALYSLSILLTDVVRVLLLFYLTPLWGTLLGALLLGERITLNRKLALALGIAGLLVVLKADVGIPLPRNLGDWMALVAGVVWAYGSLRLFRETLTPAFEQSFGFLAGGTLVSAALAFLPPAVIGVAGAEAPSAALLRDSLLPVLLVAIGLVLPGVLLIIGGGRLLSPGRVGILLMGEAVTGIATAAVLTDEPFGLREALGTALVLGAAVVEVLHRQPERLAASP